MIEGRTLRRHLVAIGTGCLLLGAAVALPVSAGPAGPEGPAIAAQNVDYLSAGSASSLNVGFPVLVPSWVPSPFGGEPSISASDGYYSLYWMNAGGDPTFLQVTGQVGGSLPAGSPYDLNNQLFVNASVNGYDAIHDVTPIYDQVWWIQDGVLYNVNSKNMADTDSLGLANSLMMLDPGSGGGGETPTEVPQVDNSAAWLSASGSASPGDAVAVSIGNATNVNVTVDGGSFAETGDVGVYGVSDGTFTWIAPTVDSTTTFTVTLTDAATGVALSSITIVVSPVVATAPPTEAPVVETTSTVASENRESDTSAASTEAPDSSEQGPVAAAPTETPAKAVTSDGTDGPPRPVVGSDGTGGIQTVEVPGSPYLP